MGLWLLRVGGFAGGIIGLGWGWDRAGAYRLGVYALALAGGSGLGFAAFASYANRVPRCDALTPVWLSVCVAAGALLFLLARVLPERRVVRLARASAA